MPGVGHTDGKRQERRPGQRVEGSIHAFNCVLPSPAGQSRRGATRSSGPAAQNGAGPRPDDYDNQGVGG
ncbi:hypothetical protein GCM10010170_024200 [Dactylosporangium salmoneum]|uniref:Uncharacterized protein n=1 Tax=Dactylosporangium salmoneum TaxID=53361 RepID=A0ABP5SZU2_9ACTN